MRRGLLLLAAAWVHAQTPTPTTPLAQDPSLQAPTYNSEVEQMGDIARQMGKAMGEIPPDVQKIAAYQFKGDPREFTPGILRHLQARIETVVRDAGRTIVTAPELKTLRVVSTDSSFRISNTAPSQEDLWKLGEKLKVDAFLEGSCARTADGDLLVSLKIFRSRTGEVVWSGNFVAGPNKSQDMFLDLDFSLSVPLRVFPVATYRNEKKGTFSGTHLVTNLSLEASVTEAVSADKRMMVTLSAGYSHLSMVGLPDTVSLNPDVHMGKAGVELLGVFFRKANPDQGYWLGTYVGYEQFLPFLYRQSFGAFTLGYRSKLSKHFTLSGGIMACPFQDRLTGMLTNSDDHFTLETIGYELVFLHYTF